MNFWCTYAVQFYSWWKFNGWALSRYYELSIKPDLSFLNKSLDFLFGNLSDVNKFNSASQVGAFVADCARSEVLRVPSLEVDGQKISENFHEGGIEADHLLEAVDAQMLRQESFLLLLPMLNELSVWDILLVTKRGNLFLAFQTKHFPQKEANIYYYWG